MRKLLLLLIISAVFALSSCNNMAGRHRNVYSGRKDEIKNNKPDSYSKEPHKTKGSYSYDKNKRRVSNTKKIRFLFTPANKRGRESDATVSKKKSKLPANKFVNKKRSDAGDNPGGMLRIGSHGKGRNSGWEQERGIFSTSNYRKESVIVTRKGFSNLEPAGKRRENLRFNTENQDTKGSYQFNATKKRVIKKKFLFIFKRTAKEKETSTFSGGRMKKIFRFNVFSKRKRATIHRNGIFRRKKDNNNKRKKNIKPELFNPGMGIRI